MFAKIPSEEKRRKKESVCYLWFLKGPILSEIHIVQLVNDKYESLCCYFTLLFRTDMLKRMAGEISPL